MATSNLLLPNLSFSILLIVVLSVSQLKADETVSFSRDVRPILASKCFACHGPDKNHQEAGLRFDLREVAVEMEAIVPGKPDQSGLVERIFSGDKETLMPPPHVDQALTKRQKEILKKWISQGAKYEKHWAFEKPVLSKPPAADPRFRSWPKNGIDNFVLKRLAESGMSPNKTADRFSLVRRVYLDLIGLPPTIEEADQFVNSKDPQAYERLVDKLLSSEHYGERWAQPWLDLARYADTNGYEKDRERSIWPYRDWVIRKLNADMPYDRFTIEQLAGDMLENPTPDQLIATGFHRNTMLNEEGGIDPLEYRFLAMVDRVSTTGTVWLGLTVGCAQCHTHKYDPISHTDYYKFMALMNNADEPDYRIPDQKTFDSIESAKRKLAELELSLGEKFPPADGDGSEQERRKSKLEAELAKWIESQQPRIANWQTITPSEMKTNLPKLELMDDGSIFATGDTTKRDVYDLTFELKPDSGPDSAIGAFRIEAIPDERLPDGGPGKTYYEGRKGDFFLSEIDATVDGKEIEFASASHSYSKPKDTAPKTRADNVFDGDGSTGWQPGSRKATRLQLVVNLKKPIAKPVVLKMKLLFERHYTVSLGRFRISTTTKKDVKANRLGESVEKILATNRESWSDSEKQIVKREFLLSTPLLKEARKEVDAERARIPTLKHSMVMQERKPDDVRTTFRHHRGEWLSPRESVTPGLPVIFDDKDNGTAPPTNRLEFANWLVSDSNPLAARVAVNRGWREIFGAGLMRTSGDFGVQASLPTHPELLDWLALEYKNEMKWSTKSLHRLIVTSATYRQASELSGNRYKSARDILLQDPDNRLLTRGPHFRVSGEMVRDIALKSTGALSKKMFGLGVRPPQPKSVTSLAFGNQDWQPATGPDRFRRSIYTFKKRTASFAAYTVFDGPTGEACTAKRNRSNTPLQALTVLNDVMYMELAQKMAKRFVDTEARWVKDRAEQNKANKVQSDKEALVWIFRSFLTRPPSEEELANLQTFFDQQLKRLGSNELEAEKIGDKDSTPRQAALAMVARVVMNLDETITKR